MWAIVLALHFPAHAADHPSMVLVVLDDARADDLAHLPAVRELAARGVSYSKAFAPYARCVPSRVSILTGNGPEKTAVKDNDDSASFDASNTVAVWLKAAGYRTAMIGKWLNRQKGGPWPIQPGWDVWRPLRRHNDYGREQATMLAQQAIDFLRDTTGPFFLYLAPAAPHAPNHGPQHCDPNPIPPLPQPPSFDSSRLGTRVETKRWPQRLSALCGVSEMIRSIVDHLDEHGRLSDTVIIVTSDQGYLLGEHNLVGKNVLYEEAIRVPLVLAGPGLPRGVERRRLVSLIDLAPTIAGLGGASIPPVDGRSFLTGTRRKAVSIESIGCRGERLARRKTTTCGGVTRSWNLVADPFELAPCPGASCRTSEIAETSEGEQRMACFPRPLLTQLAKPVRSCVRPTGIMA